MFSTSKNSVLYDWPLCLLCCLLMAGCLTAMEESDEGESGQVPGPDFNGAAPNPGGGSDGSAGTMPVAFEAAAPVMPRLTATQYRNTLEDIFGSDLPETPLEADTNPMLFFAIGATTTDVSALGVERYADAAFDVASHVFASGERRAALLQCGGQGVDDACIVGFITRMGRRLYRRPLSEAQIERWREVVALTADGNIHRGLENMLAGMLQSTHFLYRIELGETDPDDPGSRRYTAFEMAGRLAFLLTDSGPDEGLLDAAEAGDLLDEQSLLREARRLTALPRAQVASQEFFYQFLDLGRLKSVDRDPELYPEFSPALLWAMGVEVRLLVDDLVFRRPRDIRGLFFERRGYLNTDLAELYGVEVEGAGQGTFVPLDFEAETPRAGLLTTAAFLTMNAHQTETSPTLRGKYVRERIFCQTVPVPPDDIDLNLEQDAEEPRTLRERLEAHRENPACAGCHSFIDPPGMLFEHYDSLGQFRTEESGYPVDASGELDGVPLEDALGLAEELKTHPLVGPCIVRQFHRHAQGRLETSGERLVMEQVSARFATQGHHFDELMYDYILSPLFRRVGPMVEGQAQ